MRAFQDVASLKQRTTCSVPDTAKWARDWRGAPCWTVMAQRTGAILWRGDGAQGCWICGSTMAEKALQAWTFTHTYTQTQIRLICCKNKLLYCSCVNYLLNIAEKLSSINSPCGVEDPSELQYLPEGQGVHTDTEWAPVRLLYVPKGHGWGSTVPAGHKWPWKAVLVLVLNFLQIIYTTGNCVFPLSSPAGQIEGSWVAAEVHMLPLGHVLQNAAPGTGL